MKKLLNSILVIMLVCVTLTGCSKYELNGHSAASYNVVIQGAIFGGKGEDQIKTTVSFDPKWVTEYDNTKYNKDSAAVAVLISDEIYF